MKVKATLKSLGLKELKAGTPFWWGSQLYMKLSSRTEKYNVVSLTTGTTYKWSLDNPTIAHIKIVDDD